MDHDLARFSHDTYLVRRKVLTLLGAKFHIYDPAGEVVLFSKMKAFKLKEDIRLYASEEMSRELLAIRARNVIDFSAAYDVFDSVAGDKVGALRRKGFSSMVRDAWLVLDEHDREVGKIEEDSMGAALARRFVPMAAAVWPQGFDVKLDDRTVCTMKQNFNPFVQKLSVDFSADGRMALDRRLGLAAAVLLLAIEGRQES